MADEDLIDEQYQLANVVASGGTSQVWEVIEKGTNRHVALKLLKKDVPEFKENKAMMRREADVMKSLDHPLIIKYEKFVSNRDNTYIVMEYFRSSNLKTLIRAEPNKVHLRIRTLFESVCTALSHLHQKGYIHRDLKPDNILMNRAGEVRLCDFSLASKEVKGIGKLFAGKAKQIQGTRSYIAPETIRKAQPTVRTDLYSLGIFFFEALTSRTPFPATTPEELLNKHLKVEAPNPSEFNPNVAPEMDRLVARLLKKKPADRPATVDEVMAEVKRIRIFKADVIDEALAKKENEDADALAMMTEIRLDSRADAKLKEMLATNPEFARKYESEMKAKQEKKRVADLLQSKRQASMERSEAKKDKSPAKAPAAAPPPAPVMPVQPMPMPMPAYPPGYAQMPPGYPQYGAPMPPGMQPPMPQYPPQSQIGYPQMMPPQQMPMPYPPQQVPPGVPPQPQRPAAAPPAQAPQQRQPAQAPPAAQPPKQAPAKPPVQVPRRPPATPAPPPVGTENLDFMTDLPDVL